jgi:GNAT superfamily N-acetyltransferase
VPLVRFRWDWLLPALTVPFVPTLGPVHLDALDAALFEAVVDVAGSGNFLPYDKDRRWSDTKTETILAADIAHSPVRTLLPTLCTRDVGLLTVHLFGASPEAYDDAADLAPKLRQIHGAGAARIVRFTAPHEQPPSDAKVTRVQLREFTMDEPLDEPKSVFPLDECAADVQATFTRFTEVLGHGFPFLQHRIRDGLVGPVLAAIDDGRVVGVIGPMEILTDSRGSRRLLPQYFGVLPEWRGRGQGRTLWRAAMRWGRAHGAAYQILQTEVGGASDRLCRAEGLRSLGFVCVHQL